MLSPSLRNCAFTGLEWSFEMRALGFDEYGSVDEGRDEEEGGGSDEGNDSDE